MLACGEKEEMKVIDAHLVLGLELLTMGLGRANGGSKRDGRQSDRPNRGPKVTNLPPVLMMVVAYSGLNSRSIYNI